MTNKTLDALNKGEALIGAIIEKMEGLNKSRIKFMISLFLLFMGLRGRYNFLNMSRYGYYSEQTYRNNFQKEFDYKQFNISLIEQSCSNHLIIGFDPSFIPKSGKETEHLGWFWSGCSGKALKGLEIGGFGAIDVENNTAMSIEAIQTPSTDQLKRQGKTLVSHYTSLVIERTDILRNLSRYMAVDGYFSKKEFVHSVIQQTELDLVGKLRNDANLYYVYYGQPTGKRGRPKTVDGKIKMTQIDKRRIRLCYSDDTIRVYEGIVYSKSLKMKIKMAYLEEWEEGVYTGHYAVLFSTDVKLSGYQIYIYYRSRYQIEFLYRDAKQFTGLTHCQARDESKMYFHFNASLSTISIAKAVSYLSINKEERNAFSMSDVKTMHLNKIIANRIFANLKLDLTCKKIMRVYRDALNFGKIAA